MCLRFRYLKTNTEMMMMRRRRIHVDIEKAKMIVLYAAGFGGIVIEVMKGTHGELVKSPPS